MTFLLQNERVKEKKSDIRPETRRRLKDWLWADYMLYEYFTQKFEQRLRLYGEQKMREAKKVL